MYLMSKFLEKLISEEAIKIIVLKILLYQNLLNSLIFLNVLNESKKND